MPKMSSTDAKIYVAQDLIHTLQNTAPASQLVKLGNSHMESLISLADIWQNLWVEAQGQFKHPREMVALLTSQ